MLKIFPLGARLYLITDGEQPQDNYIDFWVTTLIALDWLTEDSCENINTISALIGNKTIAFESWIKKITIGRQGRRELDNLNELKEKFEYICG